MTAKKVEIKCRICNEQVTEYDRYEAGCSWYHKSCFMKDALLQKILYKLRFWKDQMENTVLKDCQGTEWVYFKGQVDNLDFAIEAFEKELK